MYVIIHMNILITSNTQKIHKKGIEVSTLRFILERITLKFNLLKPFISAVKHLKSRLFNGFGLVK